jgi:hypothetical protein
VDRVRRRYGRVREEIRTLADASLVLRAVAWALALPLLKHVVAVRSLASVMHLAPRRVTRDPLHERRIVIFARWAARTTRWKSGGNCLERGLIAYRYLCAAGARPTLVVGIGRGETGVMGHAWVLVDGTLVGEPPASIQPYTPVFAFGPDGRMDAQVTPATGNVSAG